MIKMMIIMMIKSFDGENNDGVEDDSHGKNQEDDNVMVMIRIDCY